MARWKHSDFNSMERACYLIIKACQNKVNNDTKARVLNINSNVNFQQN